MIFLAMNLVAADVRRLILLRTKKIRASLRRLLQFKRARRSECPGWSLHEPIVRSAGFSLFGSEFNMPSMPDSLKAAQQTALGPAARFRKSEGGL
jgi:hypothetical protein